MQLFIKLINLTFAYSTTSSFSLVYKPSINCSFINFLYLALFFMFCRRRCWEHYVGFRNTDSKDKEGEGVRTASDERKGEIEIDRV